MFASAVRSDLAIPEAMAKAMSVYLMVAIGLKGGVAVSQSGLNATVLAAIFAGFSLSLILPLLAFVLLRGFGRLDGINAGAVAAHYGSVSVVTFVTASEIYQAAGSPADGYMVAVLAIMETPAILTGLMLARRWMRNSATTDAADTDSSGLVREVLLNASVILLLGSFVIGTVVGESGFADIEPLFKTGFNGVLCLFLLDMGLLAARRLREARALTARLAILALVFPLVNGTIAVFLGTLVGLPVGSAAALGVLGASASYIAVPAAMRLALPQADPGIYLTMSLSITFPFNILIGIQLFAALALYLH
ncbi:sodium-dependent bicarbonate transport family permease [Alteraurantiacibacter aestuarii]